MSGKAAAAGVMARPDLFERQMSTGSGRVAQAAQRAPLQQSGNAAAGVMARQDLIDRQMGAERALASQAQGPQQQAAQRAFDRQFQEVAGYGTARYIGAVPLDRQAFQQAFDRGYARPFENFMERSRREGHNYFAVAAGVAGAECAQSALASQAPQQAQGPQVSQPQQQAAQAGGSNYRVSTPEAEFYHSEDSD